MLWKGQEINHSASRTPDQARCLWDLHCVTQILALIQNRKLGQSSSTNKSVLPNFTIIYWNLSHSEFIAEFGDLKLLKISQNTLHYI